MISPHWLWDQLTGHLKSPTGKRIQAPIEVAAKSVVGNNAATAGDSQNITASVEGGVLGLVGGILGFRKVTLSQLADQAAYSALVNVSGSDGPPSALAYAANSLLARIGTAAPAAFTGAANRLLGWDSAGALGAQQVTPSMVSPLIKTFEVALASAVSVGANIPLSTVVAALTKGTWAAASGNTQTLPSTGIYRVRVDLYPLLSAATNPHDGGLALYLGSTDVVHMCYESRDAATANLAVHYYCEKEIAVTDTAQALGIRALGGAISGFTNLFSSATAFPNPNRIVIEKLCEL